MSEYLSVSEEKNTENIYGPEDVLSVSGDYGVVNQIEFQGRSFAGASVSNYGVVYTKNVVYTKSPLKANPYGIIKTNKGKVGIVSVLYGIYIASNEVCPELIQTYFEQDARLNNYLRPLVNKGAKNTLLISDEDALKGNVVLPPTYDEQIKIKRVFEQIDNLITLHQCKQKSKSDEGKDTAKKADAKNLANDWEQRKFRECVIIERGGSPRPIDDYITSESDGLNWIKIGDAPEQGNYITKTAEKIKPSGLPKTRQVQIGDLILSNSMSFGKPYIMAINGCIHDGWLLIRDTEHRFNLLFLCQLLGTPQMLSQYKSSAAGSTVNNLNKELVGNTTVLFPDRDEQQYVGELFSALDNLITLHRCKDFSKRECCETLKIHKKHKTMATTWEQRKLGIFAEKVIEKNSNMIYKETFTNSAEYGIISQRDFFDHDISKQASLSGYYVIQENDFVYNPRISVSAPVGPINCNKLGRKGVMSPLYTVFRARDVDFVYLEYFFKTKIWHSYMRFNGDSGARSDRFSIKDELFFEMPIPMPDVKEQKVIGDTLKNIDNLITLHQRG